MLTENHRRYILSVLGHVEREVQEGLYALTDQDPDALFPRYADYPAPQRIAAVKALLAKLRSSMRRFMDSHDLTQAALPPVDATWAFLTRMLMARNAVYDLRPRVLRGYGKLDASDERECNAFSAELALLLEDIGNELRHAPLRLPEGVASDGLLALLVEIVERHHFLEFREGLRKLSVDRGTTEVAILGRVSSGKSSLMNALLETPLLPTGAIPITSVVTRIRHGNTLRIEAVDVDGKIRAVAPEDLSQCIIGGGATDTRLREVDVALPAKMLEGGIVLTDTPGLGSLQAGASAHALTYLPQCDLGIVMLDASATLSTLDADLLQALDQARAQSMVLLSKADTVTPEALAQQTTYVQQKLSEILNEPVPVSPLSVVDAWADRFREWRGIVLAPALAACIAASAERARQRTLRLARQVQSRLDQELHEGPSNPPVLVDPGPVLAAINEAGIEPRYV